MRVRVRARVRPRVRVRARVRVRPRVRVSSSSMGDLRKKHLPLLRGIPDKGKEALQVRG